MMTAPLELKINALVRLPKFETLEELADYVEERGIAWVRLEADGVFSTTEDQLLSDGDVGPDS